jgi:biopolymer transport protein ExbD
MRLILRIVLIVTAVALGVRAWERHLRHSTGFYIQLPAHKSQSECGDFDVIVLRMSKEHLLSINSEGISRPALAWQLHNIYSTRAERLLLIRADPELTFQDVAEMMDLAHGAVENLYVTLITPGAEKEPCLFIVAPRASRP